jgi:predicted TIM-barrel fold metal-dependent hydrolase
MLLNDIDDAVADVHWIADHGLMGGVLLSSVPPNAGIDPLHAPTYDPIWRACEERGVVVNLHGGGGGPDHGTFPGSPSIFVLEAAFYAHRPLWALVMSGVFDRFPGLRLVFTEAASAWVAPSLAAMDNIQAKQEKGNIGVMPILSPMHLSRRPSEYWQTNCWLGASFMTREDALERDAVGVDRIMWGSDYPHDEGTFPFTREALAHTFAGIDRDEVAAMVGGNAAEVYGFDLAALQPIADRIGPDADAIYAGIDTLPDSTSMAFEPRRTGVA